MLIKILKLLLVILIIIIVFIVSIFVYAISQKPSLDKNWQEDSKILPNILISEDGNFVTVKNIRDWRYSFQEIISKDYFDDVFDVSKLSRAYLLFNPFGQWDGIGHSFFVFEFDDGKEISISIEARREEGEDYKVELGLVNKYELWYAIGSSADFLTRRAIHYNEDLYMYPLLVSSSSAQALFLDMVNVAHDLENNPAFYNTLTSNCTNLLAESANRVKSGSVPWHYSRILTGFADDQMYDLGFIRNDKPFDEIYFESRIDEKIRQNFSGLFSKEDFWKMVRGFVIENSNEAETSEGLSNNLNTQNNLQIINNTDKNEDDISEAVSETGLSKIKIIDSQINSFNNLSIEIQKYKDGPNAKFDDLREAYKISGNKSKYESFELSTYWAEESFRQDFSSLKDKIYYYVEELKKQKDVLYNISLEGEQYLNSSYFETYNNKISSDIKILSNSFNDIIIDLSNYKKEFPPFFDKDFEGPDPYQKTYSVPQMAAPSIQNIIMNYCERQRDSKYCLSY